MGQAYTQCTTQNILLYTNICCVVCVCPLWSSSSPTSWCAIAWRIKRCITLIYMYIFIYICSYLIQNCFPFQGPQGCHGESRGASQPFSNTNQYLILFHSQIDAVAFGQTTNLSPRFLTCAACWRTRFLPGKTWWTPGNWTLGPKRAFSNKYCRYKTYKDIQATSS